MTYRSTWPSSSRPGDSLQSCQRPSNPFTGLASEGRFIVLLFSAIIGSAAVAFPEYRQALVYGLVALLGGALIVWQRLRIRELEAKNDGPPEALVLPALPPAAGWEDRLDTKLRPEGGPW